MCNVLVYFSGPIFGFGKKTKKSLFTTLASEISFK